MQRTISHGTFAYAALIDLLAALSDTPPPDNEETEALRDAINKAAEIGYRVCAETRHVTLGDKVRNAILSAFNNGGK